MGNEITANGGGTLGGGVFIENTSNATLVNNVVADNWLSHGSGPGIGVAEDSVVRLLHTTVARNRGGGGQGIYAVANSSLWITNTILVSHTVGIEMDSGTATLNATLWGDGAWANGTDWAGAGTIVTGTANWWGDPQFVNPGGGDYRIGLGSAALDVGVFIPWIDEDLDGNPRPDCAASDLGAHELQGQACWHVCLPLALRDN